MLTPELDAGHAPAPQLVTGRLRNLTRREVVHVDAGEIVLPAAHGRAAGGPIDAGALREHGDALRAGLPWGLANRLRRFGIQGGPSNALLVRGLVPALPDVGPTPSSTVPEFVGAGATRASLALLAAMSVLGDSLADRSGRLVRHVLPVPGQEASRGNGGSTSFQPWRVQDAHADDRCHYIGLLCMRGAADAMTLFSTIRGCDLAPVAQQVLREPRFVMTPGGAPAAAAIGRPVPVISGPPDDLRLRVDSTRTVPLDPRDRQAETSLTHLQLAMEDAATGQVLEPGDLLVLDNRRVAHARTPFRAYSDGTDRWLLRVLVTRPCHGTSTST